MHLHGLDQVDTSRVPGAMDALLSEGDLRALRPSVLVHADLLAGHAAQATDPRCGRRPRDFSRVGGQGLAALHPGRFSVARHRPAHRLPHL